MGKLLVRLKRIGGLEVGRHKVAFVLIAVLALGFGIPFTLMNIGAHSNKSIHQLQNGLRPATVTTTP